MGAESGTGPDAGNGRAPSAADRRSTRPVDRDGAAGPGATGSQPMMSSGDTSPRGTPTGESATYGDPPAAASVEAGWKLTAESLTVTALFDSRASVEAALDALYTVGMPRDLIEVVVSREAAAHFPAGVARRSGRSEEHTSELQSRR